MTRQNSFTVSEAMPLYNDHTNRYALIYTSPFERRITFFTCLYLEHIQHEQKAHWRCISFNEMIVPDVTYNIYGNYYLLTSSNDSASGAFCSDRKSVFQKNSCLSAG